MWLPSASLVGATWRKSSHSGGEGQCVEIARNVMWRKSSRSGGLGQCVELAQSGDWAAIRDSKNPAGPAMVIKPAQLRALVRAVAPIAESA